MFRLKCRLDKKCSESLDEDIKQEIVKLNIEYDKLMDEVFKKNDECNEANEKKLAECNSRKIDIETFLTKEFLTKKRKILISEIEIKQSEMRILDSGVYGYSEAKRSLDREIIKLKQQKVRLDVLINNCITTNISINNQIAYIIDCSDDDNKCTISCPKPQTCNQILVNRSEYLSSKLTFNVDYYPDFKNQLSKIDSQITETTNKIGIETNAYREYKLQLLKDEYKPLPKKITPVSKIVKIEDNPIKVGPIAYFGVGAGAGSYKEKVSGKKLFSDYGPNVNTVLRFGISINDFAAGVGFKGTYLKLSSTNSTFLGLLDYQAFLGYTPSSGLNISTGIGYGDLYIDNSKNQTYTGLSGLILDTNLGYALKVKKVSVVPSINYSTSFLKKREFDSMFNDLTFLIGFLWTID